MEANAQDRSPSRLNPWLALVAAVLFAAAVQLAATDGYVFHGGLFTDDWAYVGTERFSSVEVLWEEISRANRERPLGMGFQALTTAASGESPEMHALWGFLTHLACVVGVFFVARALGMALAAAAAVALLVMAFPYSDSIWLWHAASHSSLAIAIAAGGVLLALRGLRSQPAWPWHLAAALAFAASVVTYQVVLVAVLLMAAVYLPRASRREALLLTAKDVAAAFAAAFVPALIAGGRGDDSAPAVESVGEALRHAEEIADQGVSLLAVVLVPFGSPHTEIVVAVACGVVLAASAVAIRSGGEAGAHARRWLGWALCGIAIVVAGYAVFVPGTPEFYLPLIGGMGNRINALTGVGFSVFVVAVAMLAAGLPLAWRRWPAALTPVLAGALVLVVAGGYVARVHDDVADWTRASDAQTEQVAALERIGRPPARSTDYVFGGLGETAEGVFVFQTSYDLGNAVRLLWDDPFLRAFPIFDGTRVVCEEVGVYPDGPGLGLEQAAAYPDVLLTDLRDGTRVRIRDEAACRRWVGRFEAGPPTG